MGNSVRSGPASRQLFASLFSVKECEKTSVGTNDTKGGRQHWLRSETPVLRSAAGRVKVSGCRGSRFAGTD
jgi:hypothetical protein